MIRVYKLHRAGKKHIEAQWADPLTGKKKTRSTGTNVEREADRFIARLEGELNDGTFREKANITWDALCQRYRDEVLAGLADNTLMKFNTGVNAFNRTIGAKHAAAITTDVLSQFSTKLRRQELAAASIAGYLAELRRVLNWGAELKLIPPAPKVKIPKVVEGMKGRAVTGEEFDRMLAVVEAKCGKAGAESWTFLLNGLWIGGLRITEAMRLSWDDPSEIMVTTSGKFTMLQIQAASQKSREYQLLPIVDDFADFLNAVPEAERTGYVFNPRPFKQPFDVRSSADWVGRIVSRIGKAARVRVNPEKFASCHDLRRSFGTRWAVKVMPAVLQSLMRHRAISTTMEFYIGQNAQAMATAARDASRANHLANSHGNSASVANSTDAQSQAT